MLIASLIFQEVVFVSQMSMTKVIFTNLSFQEVVFVSQDVNDNGFDVPVTCPHSGFVFNIVDGQSSINLIVKGKLTL